MYQNNMHKKCKVNKVYDVDQEDGGLEEQRKYLFYLWI